jgi:hypothetical protein
MRAMRRFAEKDKLRVADLIRETAHPLTGRGE